MQKYLLSLFIGGIILFVSLKAIGQQTDFDHFEPLTCQGDIPKSFLELSSQKAQRDKQRQASQAKKRSELKTREEFVLASNFIIDQMLHSGKVLFNDPVSAYINRVADYLLRDEPQLRSELQFYAVKSTAVNAFTTQQGIIFVNIGLLAKLENEAQLAFVLSHEIQHYRKKHTVDQYLEIKKIQKGKGDYAGLSFDEKLLESSNYSKSNETEADLEGLKLFLTSAYSRAAPDEICGILSEAWRPIEEMPYDGSNIELATFQLPESYFCDSLTPVELEEDYDDELFSHPNIASRREAIADALEEMGDSETGTPYIFGPEAFQEIQKTCRYEMAWLYLESFGYEHALYHTAILQRDDPNSFFLKKVVVRALYGLAKYRNEGNFKEVHVDSEDIAGEPQNMFCVMEALLPTDLTVMSLAHSWELQSAYPDDPDLPLLTYDMCKDLATHHPTLLKICKRKALEEPEEAEPSDTTGNSKNPPLKIQQQTTLINLLKQEEFLNVANKAKKEVDKEIREKRLNRSKTAYQSWAYRFETNSKHNKLTDESIRKMTMVRPTYTMYKDKPKDRKVQFVEGENRTADYREILEDNAKSLKMDVKFLDITDMKKGDVERFNQMVILEHWKNETILRGDLDMVPLYAGKLQDMKKQFGSEHFAWSYVIKVTDVPGVSERILYLIGFSLYIVTAPYGLYKAIANRNQALKITFVLNSETFEHEFFELVFLKKKDNDAYLKSNSYHTLHQLKTSK